MRPHDGETNAGRSLAVITGASSGIGFYLAKECAENGYDLLIAADSTELEEAAGKLRSFGGDVQTVETDLATTEGVDELYEADEWPARGYSHGKCWPWFRSRIPRSRL